MISKKLIALVILCSQLVACNRVQTKDDIASEINRIYSRDSIVNINKNIEFNGDIEEYVSKLGDKYSKYIPPQDVEVFKQRLNGYYCGVGITCKLAKVDNISHVEIVGVTEASPADTIGIVKGSELLKVNGESIASVASEEELRQLLNGNIGDDMQLEIKQGSDTINYNVRVGKIKNKEVTYKVLNENIGYVAIHGFKQGVKEDFDSAIEELVTNNIHNFIFDVRDNGGGYVSQVIPVIDRVTPEGPLVTITESNNKSTNIVSDKTSLTGTIVILVNENTASAAELFTISIKERNLAKVVGTKTYGKATELGAKSLSNGGLLILSTGYYRTERIPSIEGIGIHPDVEVKNEGSEDSQLEKAIDILNKRNTCS